MKKPTLPEIIDQCIDILFSRLPGSPISASALEEAFRDAAAKAKEREEQAEWDSVLRQPPKRSGEARKERLTRLVHTLSEHLAEKNEQIATLEWEKKEAVKVLGQWDEVHDLLASKAPVKPLFGESKSKFALAMVKSLLEKVDTAVPEGSLRDTIRMHSAHIASLERRVTRLENR